MAACDEQRRLVLVARAAAPSGDVAEDVARTCSGVSPTAGATVSRRRRRGRARTCRRRACAARCRRRTPPASARANRCRWSAAGVRISSGTPRYVGELVDLRLVEVRDRLHVGRAVAVLDEEALVVLQAVRRAGHRVVQPVGVVVLDLLARALLHVGRGDDAEIDVERHARLAAPRRAGRAPRGGRCCSRAVPRALRSTTLSCQPGPYSGNSAPDELVAAPVAAGAVEDRRDVLEHASRCRATRPRARPRRRLSGSESCSGMNTPSTLLAARRRARRAPRPRCESTPPERPSTTPRRRRRFSTCSRSAGGDALDLGRGVDAKVRRAADGVECGRSCAPSARWRGDLAVLALRQLAAEFHRLRAP